MPKWWEKSSKYHLCIPLFKVNGRKLYEYARAGEEVERPVRQVTIMTSRALSEIGYEEGLARFRFRVKCSKGTYIRTLSVDLGQKLGYSSAHVPSDTDQCCRFVTR
ncbi:MAG: hypothetical protein ACLRZG_07105 [Streptococcus sp.]